MKTNHVTEKPVKYQTMNGALTQRVIELHNQGYELDFYLVDDRKLVCVQSNTEFSFSDIQVKLVDQVFNRLIMAYQYVHIVDSGNGEKGLLIIPNIYMGSNFWGEQDCGFYYGSLLTPVDAA